MTLWLRARRASALICLLVAGLVAGSVQAEDHSLPGLQGGRLREADLARGNAIVIFWASWSPRCRDIVPRANAIARRWGQAAQVVTVNFQEDQPTVETFLATQKLAVPVYLDASGSFAKSKAISTLPGLLIYHDGVLAYQGKLPANPDNLLEQVLGPSRPRG